MTGTLTYREEEEMRVGIFGGDARHYYAAQELWHRGYEVTVFEKVTSSSSESDVEEGKQGDFSSLVNHSDVLIGPIVASRITAEQADCIQRYFSGALFSGKIPAELEKGKLKTYDFYRDPEFVKINSELTAEGVLAEIIKAWPGAIKNAKVLVTGYGNCGKEIAKTLKLLGADVKVCVRRIQSAWELYSERIVACFYESLTSTLPEMDIVINTVPTVLFGEKEIQSTKRDVLLVEVASAPGGFDLAATEKAGRTLLKCPGMPGKYCPRAAGIAMADCVERYEFLS